MLKGDIGLKKLSLEVKPEIKRDKRAIEVLEAELVKLNNLKPIKDGEILINTTHIVKQGDAICIGFYIRNATAQKINISYIPIKILYKEGETIDKKKYKLKHSIEISPYRAVPYSINIDNIRDSGEFEITVDSRLGVINKPT